MEYSFSVKIPKKRIGVLIGSDGETKKELEEQTNAKLNIDSQEGDVIMVGEDSIKLYTLRSVVKAIGRGFNPDIAQLLLRQDYNLELVNILDYVNNRDNLGRVKGRVIGKKGKSRETIEKLSETYISVFGKTVGIIGKPENITIARRAVESLCLGSPHSNVYSFLEKHRRRMKEQELLDW